MTETRQMFQFHIFIAYDASGHFDVGATASDAKSRLRECGVKGPLKISKVTTHVEQQPSKALSPYLIAGSDLDHAITTRTIR